MFLYYWRFLQCIKAFTSGVCDMEKSCGAFMDFYCNKNLKLGKRVSQTERPQYKLCNCFWLFDYLTKVRDIFISTSDRTYIRTYTHTRTYTLYKHTANKNFLKYYLPEVWSSHISYSIFIKRQAITHGFHGLIPTNGVWPIVWKTCSTVLKSISFIIWI